MNPIEIKRSFTGTDAEMTSTSRVIHSLLLGELDRFTSFDATINADFANDFLDAILNAESVVADNAVIDIQVQKTELIQAAMEKAKEKYGDVKYFVQKTFPNSTGAQNEFGVNDYERARKSAIQMVQFLDEMHKACVKYQAQLIASGLSAGAILEIQTIRSELQDATTSQEVFKKQRPRLTEDRITTLNECYEILVQINAAAQRVYKNDYAKRNQFVYKVSSGGSDVIEFSGEVLANSIAIAGTVPFDADNVFSFMNVGLVPLVFCLSTTTAFEGIEISIGGGATINKTAGELNPNATNLLVKNTSLTEVGVYEIDVDN